MSEITIEQVRSLRKALTGITPLPWFYDPLGLFITAKRGQVKVADIPVDVICEMRGFGSGEPQLANLAAIVAMMNAAPSLLSIAERALMAQEQGAEG